jgi:hypothetical protein
MARLIALIAASMSLAGCSGGITGDVLPEWAGGYAKGVPPRPGTPEYDAYRQKIEAEASRDKSKDPPRTKSDAAGLPGLPQ